ncbi:hypothetical protein OG741_23040 [Streptomyces sp. NBC_01410]|uniref:hypothetical protein n=1 Tax=Streptomyces sp. NBC_01410 TaxID=2903856 RepID=UPI003251BD08
MRKATAVAAGGVVLLGLGVLPAHAEGHRSTYISVWERGHESNRWYDRNSDSIRTAVSLTTCHTDAIFSSATLKLSKEVDFAPDENRGSRTNYCNATSNWGDESAGTYYFTLTGFNGGSRLSVNSVGINW